MRLVNLPIDNLRTLVAVVDLGSYTRAAERIGRSQPAVTLQIQKLQELAGCRIMKSGGRDFRLTEDGELLLRYARQILRLNDEIASRLQRQKPEGVVRIGLPTDYAVAFFQRVLTNFVEQHNEVELEISCQLSAITMQRLANDELDLAIAMYSERQNDSLAYSWAERPIWVTAEGSDAHHKDPVPIAAHDKGCEYRERMIRALDAIGRPWRIAYVSPGVSGLQEAVKSGFGVSALTRRTLMRGMQVLTETDGYPALPDIRIGLHYKHSNLSTAALMLVSYVVQSLHDSGQTDIIRIERAIGRFSISET